MSVQDAVAVYISAQPDRKRAELQALHDRIRRLLPRARLWFLDGTDERGKVVTNPNIGYGTQLMRYANGSTREFYQVGLSANTTGISVYLMGLSDKAHLKTTYGSRLGKASVTGYCIKFRALADIDVAVLESAILDAVGQTGT